MTKIPNGLDPRSVGIVSTAIAQTRVAFLAWLSLMFLVMSILSSSYQVSHWKETTLVSIEIQRQHEHRHGFCRRQLDH